MSNSKLSNTKDEASKFLAETSINAAPSNIMNPTSKILGKRKVVMNNCAKQKKEKINKKIKVDEIDDEYLKDDQYAWMEKALKLQKKMVRYLEDKCSRLTGMVRNLAMVLIESNNNSEIEIYLGEIIEQLRAANAQLLVITTQLANI